jgi:hypothetical protein
MKSGNGISRAIAYYETASRRKNPKGEVIHRFPLEMGNPCTGGTPSPSFCKFLFLKGIAKLGLQIPLPIGVIGKILSAKDLGGIFRAWTGALEGSLAKNRVRTGPAMGRSTFRGGVAVRAVFSGRRHSHPSVSEFRYCGEELARTWVTEECDKQLSVASDRSPKSPHLPKAGKYRPPAVSAQIIISLPTTRSHIRRRVCRYTNSDPMYRRSR